MQKEYKRAYFNLTRHSPLPLNCMPLSSKGRHSASLLKLLQIMEPKTNSIFQKKRQRDAQIIHFQRSLQTERTSFPRRIHHNIGQISSTKYALSDRNNSYELNQVSSRVNKVGNGIEKASSTFAEPRKDVYDQHIEKYINTKYDNDDLIKKYLNNRQEFIKHACQDIQKEIKQEHKTSRKSSQKSQSRHYSSRLPKIDQISSHMLQKSNHKIRNGAFQQQLSQLKKATELNKKHRKRNQRVFRRKINSLEIKLDKIIFQDRI